MSEVQRLEQNPVSGVLEGCPVGAFKETNGTPKSR